MGFFQNTRKPGGFSERSAIEEDKKHWICILARKN